LTKLYNQIKSDETFRTKHDIMRRCVVDIDPEHTYMYATREIESALEDSDELNLIIIE